MCDNSPDIENKKNSKYVNKIEYTINNIKNVIDEVESDIEDNYDCAVETIKNARIKLSKHDIDYINVNINIRYILKSLLRMYDISIDNLPFASIMGFIITVTSFTYTWSGVNGVDSFFYKYFNSNDVDLYLYYSKMATTFVILLHVAILLHGFSIFILETSREVYNVKRPGCYCCKKYKVSQSITPQNHNLNMINTPTKRCILAQWIAQTVTQILWGFIGTLSCFVVYIFSIALFNMSSIATTTSYLLKTNCNKFKDFVVNVKTQSNNYLILAKSGIRKSNSAILIILSQYNKWIDMKNKFLENTQQSIIDTPTKVEVKREIVYIGDDNYYIPSKLEHYASNNRILTQENNTNEFNILNELSKGQSVISILNKTIIETENQLIYYEDVFSKSLNVCYDYGNIYDSFNYITIGLLLLLMSHLLMTSAHYKYFSVWLYEVKLAKLNR